MKKEITSRTEVSELVRTFYAKIRKHETLGPIFNGTIKDWEGHLEKLTDFWETNLFFVRNYKGNPMKVHAEVDQKFDHSISQAHFDNWLQIWFATVDQLFEGKNAHLAKERARSIAHIMFLKIFSQKPVT